MTKNKGKSGEMVVSVIAASISYHENGVDFTRPSVTNSADMGADLFIRHPPGFLENVLLPVADGTYLPPPTDAPKAPESSGAKPTVTPPQTTRVDVKTTDGKLGVGTVDKFVADIPKHPTCTGHLLMGGAGLTKPAERKLVEAQTNFKGDGLILAYVNNDGVRQIGEHYCPPKPILAPDTSQDNVSTINHSRIDPEKDPGTI